MQLQDLKSSISEMSTEDLINLIKEIRTNRRSRKETAATKKSQPKAKSFKLSNDTDDLSIEQIDAILKKLGRGGEDGSTESTG